jgi:hypothetical protein
MQQLPVDTQASGVTILEEMPATASLHPSHSAKKNAPARGLPGHSKEGVHRNSANTARVAEAHGGFVTNITYGENDSR